jgi:Spy/CpxP family protein refolding chaperone
LYASTELNKEQKDQITLQVQSKEFEQWFGFNKKEITQDNKGYDNYGNPRLKDNLYIINNKNERIKLYDLTNDKFYNKIQSFNKIQVDLKDILKVIETNTVSLLTKIGTYKGTIYAENLKKELEDFNKIQDNNLAEKLIKLSDYITKTLTQFELRLAEHEKKNLDNLNEKELLDYKEQHFNFVLQAKDFINTFENITKLPSADNFQDNLKPVIEVFKNLESKVSDLKNNITKEVNEEWNERLKNLSSNPEVINNVLDFLSIQQDETAVQRMVDAMGDSNNPILSALDKKYKRQLYSAKLEIAQKTKEWDEFCKKNNLKSGEDFKKFLDENNDLLDEFNYTNFKEEYNKFKEPVIDLINQGKQFKEDGKTFTKEYLVARKKLNKWKRENIRQPYIKEYYEALDNLIPEAEELYTEIQNKKQEILSKKDEDITIEDIQILKDLENQVKELKSSVYKDGTKKEGKDLEIANSLYKYSKELNKFFETESINQKAFDKAREKAKKENKEDEFLEQNTKKQFSIEFQKSFNSLMGKFPTYKELDEIKNKINQLLINYKDFNGVNTEILPKQVLEEYKKLQLEKNHLKNNLIKPKEAISKNTIKEFKNLVEFTPSEYYIKTKEKKIEDLKNGIITEEEYSNWYNENHEYDEYLEETTPTSLNTIMQPRDKNQIIVAPINKWNITKVKAEYHNIKGNEAYWKLEDGVYEPNLNNNGYSFPVNKWKNEKFTNLSISEQEQLNYIKSFLKELIKHTDSKKTINGKTYSINDTSIGKNGLPSIPLLEPKKEKKEKSNIKFISESGDIVQKIPLRYINQLNQLELPKIIEGMTDEEIEKTKKEIDKIKQENKKRHSEALNTNLAETMKYFIDSAITSKKKDEMFLLVKSTLNQFKELEFKATNAKGDSIIDKTKSFVKGEQVEHTINGLESNAYKHFKNWVEGVYYEEFNLDEGNLSKLTEKALTVTSFINIGFNILGGINNKIVASIQLKLEAAGGQYFNAKELAIATKRLYTGSLTFINDSNKEGATSLDSGLIKFFDILQSQDELGELPTGKIATDLLKKAIKYGYIHQHLGEFHAQNTLLLATLQSHRVVNGKIQSYFQYAEQFSKSTDVKKMKKEGKTLEEIKEFLKNNQKDDKTIKEEFEKYESLENQFELIEGEAKLKKSSILTNEQIGDFRERVIGINQKLHGIYNIEDAAMLQRYALGRLGLQFRKWMMPAWNRRFGQQFGKTTWNERRGEYDEGMYITFGKFIASPFIESFADYKNNKEKTAMGAFNVLLKGFSNFIDNTKINWMSLTMYEKANVKKVCMEMLLIIGTLSLGYILKNLGDDDKEKNLFHTWLLNQTNRLYGELTVFNFSALNEGNKLISNPLPVLKTLDNIKKLTFEVVKYPFINEDKRIFKSGVYHGRKKASVYAIKNLPFAKNVQDLIYMQDNLERYSNFYGH